MAESETPKRVTVIREGRESSGTVENPQAKPWSVVETATAEQPAPEDVPWDVLIVLQTGAFAFTSRRDARDWAAQDERTTGFESALQDPDGSTGPDETGVASSKAATERFLQFARDNGLKPDSPEAFERAHEAGILHSVSLYEHVGCQGRVQIVETYLADWDQLGLNWAPQSCKCYNQGTLYAQAFGKTYGGRAAPVVAGGCVDDLPFQPKAIESE